MDTRFLESFLIVIEQGSLAGAARQLRLTPASVAQRIRALEDEIGCPIVQRVGRNVRPTEQGLAILEQSRAIITSVRDLCAIAASDKPVGTLRIGAISSAANGLLPPYLKRFFECFPEIELHITPGSSSGLHNAVLEGNIDAAFIVEPPFEIPKTLVWQTLRSEPLVVLAPAVLQETDPHEILRNHPLIRYDRMQWGGRLADEYLRKSGIWPHERLELDSLDAIAIIVSQGTGVSLVPDWARPWPAGVHLKKIPLPAPAPCRNLGFLIQRNSPRLSLFNRLLEILQKPLTTS
ncbi:LysR family transcriptional regulator [Gluconobacter kondonii]|uniref:LysR family transcriptional regulator n=1 Tax=Gluconobacter kondonii TaxID=941463 RepID=A0ABQ5WVH0_9PROT|nr:LysR family transcriptional regulator [Gluconobacter kondonii]MCP1237259.1 LysR family transcriptional regulator [Gluconobacter kondonii]GBR29160.1 LysR family transcriptional regulator [Gluconobacter kondonii NBRC 3266]GLQ67512.1 LysR family transcriptional regulator [Gluconobacter kondonii]